MGMGVERPILIAGYGSIGRRHLRNLRALGYQHFVLYRSGKSTLPDDEIAGIPTEYDLNAALAHHPIATVIANPTALHLPVALAAARAGSHLLLEKPISHTLDDVEELRQVVEDNGLAAVVGFQFRFHPGLRQIKQLIDEDAIGPVVSVQTHWGEYLPGWHPWEDHRQSYSARPDLGGGVLLTLCHPFDYLRWLLGDVREVSALVGQESGLGLPVEDVADVLLRFDTNAIGHVHLDYVQRPSAHHLQMVGRDGMIRWDNADGAVQLFRASTNQWETFPLDQDFERNTLFLDEMRHFLACITGREAPLCTLDDGIYALRIALMAKQSAVEGKRISL